MSYLVTVACVIAKDQDGKLHHRYEGDVISWLSDEQAAHFLDSDLVVELGTGQREDNRSDADSGTGTESSPLRAAPKADWVNYAVNVHGVNHAEAEALSKQELIDLYGD